MSGLSGTSQELKGLEKRDLEHPDKNKKNATQWVSGGHLDQLHQLYKDLNIAPLFGELKFAKIDNNALCG